MNRKENIWVIVIVAILCTPLVLDVVKLKKPHPLNGEKTELPMPNLSFNSLYYGHYTDSLNDYLKTNFTLRGMAIRTMNQIDYSLFNETHARSVLVGKEGYLFEENYIKAALGLDDLKSTQVDSIVVSLESLSVESSTPFFIALAPGKASYFSEFIPDSYVELSDTLLHNSSYRLWSDKVSNSPELHLVDLYNHFIDWEEVFPKNGIHWCEWSQIEAFNLIADSISRVFNDSISPAKFVIDKEYRSTKMEGTDEDIERGLNLWQNIPDLERTYYNVSWDEKVEEKKPRILLVGDSYAWGIVNRGVLKHGFNESEFWYYNQVVHGPKYLDTELFGEKPNTVHNISSREDLINTLYEFDAVILLSTDANLFRFPFSFGRVE